MSIYFEIGVKYVRMDENGHERKVSELYLLDAISFTEAEARIYKELQVIISGEFNVMKIAKTNISEIIPSDNGDRWYKAKVSFITVDEESGKEKRIVQNIISFANSVDEADKNIKEAMTGMMTDFEITAIVESKIIDVFPYSEAISANMRILTATNEMIPVEIGITSYEDDLKFIKGEMTAGEYAEKIIPNSPELKKFLDS